MNAPKPHSYAQEAARPFGELFATQTRRREGRRHQGSEMAEITKLLGIAISDADAGRITRGQLLDIFQDAIDNGDILEDDNELYVVTAVVPLIDAGVLRPSDHVTTFERRMDTAVASRLQVPDEHAGDNTSGDVAGPSDSPNIAVVANAVGRILHDYIAVHDDIFAAGLLRTLRRTLPIPGFFQAIDFDRHRRTLAHLSDELHELTSCISSTAAPEQLAVPLTGYCEALSTTVRQLGHISSKLAARADDRRSYTKVQYREDLAEYERAVVTYRSEGEQVNRAFVHSLPRPSAAAQGG